MNREFRIASPCSANWEQMPGSERVRFCPECKLNVYNFSAMTEREIERIVAQHEGRLCARFYQRPDGTLLTTNCPVGFRGALLRASQVATAMLTAVISMCPALARPSTRQMNVASSYGQVEVKDDGFLEVVDAVGAMITKAKVRIVDEANRKETLRETDSQGRVPFSDLPSGHYEITISKEGFKIVVLSNFALPVKNSRTVRLDVAPTMGEVVVVPTAWLPEPSISTLPAASEPRGTTKEKDNPLKRFFGALRRIF